MASTRMFGMVKDMLKHVYNMNEMSLTDMLEVAFEMYPVRVVCSDIIAPMMCEIGSLWEKGEMMVVMEHFASNIVVSKLKSMLHKQNCTTNKNGPTVFVGCAPEEMHEIGALIVAFFMSVNGWKVVYLGQNIPLTDLYNIVDTLSVHTIALSASNERSLGSLISLGQHIQSRAKTKPIEFLIGGRLLHSVPNVLESVACATTRSADELYAYVPPTHPAHQDTMVRGALDGSYSLIKESYRKMRLASERRKRTKFLLDQITTEDDESPTPLIEECDDNGEVCTPTSPPAISTLSPRQSKQSSSPDEKCGQEKTLDDKTKELEQRIQQQRMQTEKIKEKLQRLKQGKKTAATYNPENRLVSGKYTPPADTPAECATPPSYRPPENLNRLIGQPKKPEPVTKLFHLNKPPDYASLSLPQPSKYYPKYSNMPVWEDSGQKISVARETPPVVEPMQE